MKTIARLLVILAVCVLIGAGIYWFVQSNPTLIGVGALRPNRGGEGFPQGQPALPSGEDVSTNDAQPAFKGRGEFRGERHAHEGEVLSGRAFLGILGNVAKVALITFLVWGIQKIFTFTSHHLKIAS